MVLDVYSCVEILATEKLKEVIKTFLPLQRYSLKKDGRVVEMNSKINLEKIWK